MRLFKIFIFTILLLMFIYIVGCSKTDSNPTNFTLSSNIHSNNTLSENCVSKDFSLDTWIGEYKFSEFTSPDENMFYNVIIYKEGDKYLAEIRIDGFQTLTRIQANVEGEINSVNLIFDKYLPDNQLELYSKGDILFNFKNVDSELHTNWNSIEPMLSENKKSGEVYFKKAE